MAERQNPSRRTAEKHVAAGKQTAPRRDTIEKQTPSRRSDVIRCENCGEDYSITYKRCPFCDERPGRSGIGGRRAAGGRGTVHPVQVIGLVISMIVIIVALFIVFKYVGPLIFGDKSGGQGSSVSTSQSAPGSSASASQPGGDVSSGGDVSAEIPQVPVTSLTLNKSDITLTANEIFPFVATVSPADAPVTWSSSDDSILKVEQDGTATNVNTTGSKVKVTVTATAGDKSAQCTVYCNSAAGSGTGTTTPSGGSGTSTKPSGGTVAPNTPGTIVNAGSGLNIRSGPGSSYEKLASAANGSKIIILEDTGNGWYKIDYGNGKVGYVSSDYVSVGN